jgi:hypothetical protein
MTARGPEARPRVIRPSPLSEPAATDLDPGPHRRLWDSGRLRHWPWCLRCCVERRQRADGRRTNDPRSRSPGIVKEGSVGGHGDWRKKARRRCCHQRPWRPDSDRDLLRVMMPRPPWHHSPSVHSFRPWSGPALSGASLTPGEGRQDRCLVPNFFWPGPGRPAGRRGGRRATLGGHWHGRGFQPMEQALVLEPCAACARRRASTASVPFGVAGYGGLPTPGRGPPHLSAPCSGRKRSRAGWYKTCRAN